MEPYEIVNPFLNPADITKRTAESCVTVIPTEDIAWPAAPLSTEMKPIEHPVEVAKSTAEPCEFANPIGNPTEVAQGTVEHCEFAKPTDEPAEAEACEGPPCHVLRSLH